LIVSWRKSSWSLRLWMAVVIGLCVVLGYEYWHYIRPQEQYDRQVENDRKKQLDDLEKRLNEEKMSDHNLPTRLEDVLLGSPVDTVRARLGAHSADLYRLCHGSPLPSSEHKKECNDLDAKVQRLKQKYPRDKAVQMLK
jgi:hypothetical protein